MTKKEEQLIEQVTPGATTSVALKVPKSCPSTEYSKQFLQGMIDRMAVSFHKYGLVADAYPDRVNAIESLELRLKKYRDTGNTEFLMDVANFAMIEHMHPRHQKAHYKATDSSESPGRVWDEDGKRFVTAMANDGGLQSAAEACYRREGD